MEGGMERSATESAPFPALCEGWLKKKGKKRWFVLDTTMLYWFAKEQQNTEIMRSVMLGCLPVRGAEVEIVGKPKHSISIKGVEGEGKAHYIVTAGSEMDQERWFEALQGASAAAASFEKKGNLRKKGKERFFLLSGASLVWFLPGGAKAKGSVSLEGAAVGPGTKANSVCINSKDGRIYELSCASKEEADEWTTAFREASIAERVGGKRTCGWLFEGKKGPYRWCTAANGKFVWTASSATADFEKPKGSLVCGDYKVSLLDPENGRWAVQLSPGPGSSMTSDVVFFASSKADGIHWLNGLKSGGCWGKRMEVEAATATMEGWARHNGKPAWVSLCPDSFAVYAAPEGGKNLQEIPTAKVQYSALGALGNGFSSVVLTNTESKAEVTLEFASEVDSQHWQDSLAAAGARKGE